MIFFNEDAKQLLELFLPNNERSPTNPVSHIEMSYLAQREEDRFMVTSGSLIKVEEPRSNQILDKVDLPERFKEYSNS